MKNEGKKNFFLPSYNAFVVQFWRQLQYRNHPADIFIKNKERFSFTSRMVRRIFFLVDKRSKPMYIETELRKLVDRKLSFESGPDLPRVFIQGVRRVHLTVWQSYMDKPSSSNLFSVQIPMTRWDSYICFELIEKSLSVLFFLSKK
jgi:hypothetical protein